MVFSEGNSTPPFSYFVDLIAKSPKVTRDELTPQEIKDGISRFGNNFYMLFESLREKELNPDTENPVVRMLLNKAETTYGDKWRDFLAKNRQLIDQINQALEGLEPFNQMYKYFIDLLNQRNMTLAKEFYALDFTLVGIYGWRKLNPFLKKAARKMKKEGINPEELFG